eukprot:365316-Chlamydomonas_euryale.AAC.5
MGQEVMPRLQEVSTPWRGVGATGRGVSATGWAVSATSKAAGKMVFGLREVPKEGGRLRAANTNVVLSVMIPTDIAEDQTRWADGLREPGRPAVAKRTCDDELVKDVVCLVEVEDQVQLTHIAKVPV